MLTSLRVARRSLSRRVTLARYRILGRRVRRGETAKARARREREGFFEKYLRGRGLDIGYGGDLVLLGCRGYDMEHGDAQELRNLADSSFDFVHSSHTLEHMADPAQALRNWWRVVRPGGYLVLYVPHRDLYEKKTTLPSRWNADHKHFILPDRDDPPHTFGLRPLLERTLTGYDLVEFKICDEGHTVDDPLRHSDGEYSIEAVLRKRPLSGPPRGKPSPEGEGDPRGSVWRKPLLRFVLYRFVVEI